MPNDKQKSMHLLPLVLAGSLTACAHNSTRPDVDSGPAPALPSATTPQPSQPYSTSVEQLLKTWQKMLTDTPLMSEPSAKP